MSIFPQQSVFHSREKQRLHTAIIRNSWTPEKNSLVPDNENQIGNDGSLQILTFVKQSSVHMDSDVFGNSDSAMHWDTTSKILLETMTLSSTFK